MRQARVRLPSAVGLHGDGQFREHSVLSDRILGRVRPAARTSEMPGHQGHDLMFLITSNTAVDRGPRQRAYPDLRVAHQITLAVTVAVAAQAHQAQRAAPEVTSGSPS